MGKLTISMGIFNGYVELPEGNLPMKHGILNGYIKLPEENPTSLRLIEFCFIASWVDIKVHHFLLV